MTDAIDRCFWQMTLIDVPGRPCADVMIKILECDDVREYDMAPFHPAVGTARGDMWFGKGGTKT